MRSVLIVDNTTASAASPIWYPKSTTSLELSNLTSANDVHSNEKQVFWPPKQKDHHGNLPSSAPHSGGVWPSLTNANGSSLSLFRESTDDNKNVMLLSGIPNYHSPVSSRVSNCVDQIKMSETAPACRLFGFDLRNNSNKNPPPLEKEAPLPRPSTITDCERPETDEKQHVEILASSKERKDVQMEAPPNDTQGSVPSSRTRIKVNLSLINELLEVHLEFSFDGLYVSH